MPSFEEQYPEDFPGRAALIEAAIPIVTARNLDREQLIAINGIGAKTADAIIEYFASEEDGDENGGN
jgi:endonuclease III